MEVNWVICSNVKELNQSIIVYVYE